MPKTKTSRATAKRIKVTGTGRLRRRQSGAKHMKVGRKPRSTRLTRLGGEANVSSGDRRRVARLLGR
jgi:large subunit ribosomal protein L35